MTVQPHDRLWQLGEPRRPALRVGDLVEVLALPPSLAEATWSRRLIGRVGKVVEVHDYANTGWSDAVGHEALYDVQVPGYAAFPLAPHEVRPLEDDRLGQVVRVDAHPIGAMDPHDPQRFRLSAAAERRAARAWIVAAARAHSSAEVLACTQLGRTALRQAHAYDELVADLAATA